MAFLVGNIIDGYHDLMQKQSDPRVNDWFLMSSPFPTLAICMSYVYFVKVVGPKFMENRKPFELRRVLIIYNFLQVVFSAWLFYECLISGWLRHYSFRCQPVDYSYNPLALRMANGCWWYYFSKFTEFLDTIFFVLRKKNDHVSTLHVIHHGCMPMSVWFGVKFTPGGHSSFFGLLNTFVHIIMYFYYMMAAMGPQYQRFLWWKKHLTTLQMIQFVAVMVHAFQLLFVDCNYPKAFVWWIGMHAVMFYFLFSGFYKNEYKKKVAARKARAEAQANAKLANGYAANGKIANGIAANGQIITQRQTTNGHIQNGHATNGTVLNGDATKPQTGNGHITNGHISNGHTPNGYANNGYIHNGIEKSPSLKKEATNGDVSNGAVNRILNGHCVHESVSNHSLLDQSHSDSRQYPDDNKKTT